MPLSVDRLSAEQLKALLTIDPDDLPEQDASAVRDFVERIGGRPNALLAAQMLTEIEQDQGLP